MTFPDDSIITWGQRNQQPVGFLVTHMFTVGVFLPALDPSFLTCLSTFLLPVSSHNNQRYYSSSLITVSITLCTGERSSLEHLLTFPSAAPPFLQPAVLSPELDPSVASCVCRRVCVCVCACEREREILAHATSSHAYFPPSSAKSHSPFWASHSPPWFFLLWPQSFHLAAHLFPLRPWRPVTSFMYVPYSPTRLEGSWRQGPCAFPWTHVIQVILQQEHRPGSWRPCGGGGCSDTKLSPQVIKWNKAIIQRRAMRMQRVNQ